MSAMQLSFTLRTSPNCKTVHLVGNWDGYKGQLPLSKDTSTSKLGAWKGTFRFHGATLNAGQRYWYYYVMDGYHVSHDPAQPSVMEPTTGRQLNILDIPTHKSSTTSTTSRSTSSNRRPPVASHSTTSSSTRSGHHNSTTATKPAPVHGRPISPSRIAHPRPVHATAARAMHSPAYAKQVAHLSRKLANARIDTPDLSSSGSEFEEDLSDSDSDSGSDLSSAGSVPSLGSSRTSPCSSPRSSSRGSATSGRSGRSSTSSTCSCERYGITRKGDRIRLDCGGSRCGGSDGDGDANSSVCSSDSEGEEWKTRLHEARRHGVVVRGSRGSRR